MWIRTNDKTVNIFNDFATICWVENNLWKFIGFNATTDPGLYWLNNPLNVKGTAILKPGQYLDCWQRGLHKGYPALVQVRPVTVYRDTNRDNKLDLGKEDTGLFGINSHESNHDGVSAFVDKWSAGCLVMASSKAQNRYMDIIGKFKKTYHTITLIEEKDL